jgi:hypothetical protein
MIPVLQRLPDVEDMIQDERYFIISAPRQSGKTTYLLALTEQINLSGRFHALNCSLETLDGIVEREAGIEAILSQIHYSISRSHIKKLISFSENYTPLPHLNYTSTVKSLLNHICDNLDKEVIIFFDEADCLSVDPLITFLRQIRLGYNTRCGKNRLTFPRSLALSGMRDIRDHLRNIHPDSISSGVASIFNFKTEALTLSNFTRHEINTLYNQHTEACGQIFEPEAVERAYYWSEGQPWLVNALAYEIVVKILKNNYTAPVTKDLMDQAAEAIIKNRQTHIDSLMERLQDPRVVTIMDSVFAGTLCKVLKNSDDYRYCLDLGLVVEDENRNLRPANAIYREVMSRSASDEFQSAIDNKISEI